MTSTRAMLGSPAYMSPEQVRSAKKVDGRTDIWALGIILYELLTARAPFDADSLPGLIAAIISDPPVDVRCHRPDLPPDLASAVMTCLQKDPAQRFESVAALVSALEPFAPAEDAGLVARIIRLQKTAGLTQLDTTRPPAPSVSNEVSQAASHATAASFGVTVGRKPLSKRWLAAGLIAVACLVAGGGVAWWMVRGASGVDASAEVADIAAPVESETEPAVEMVEEDTSDAGLVDAGQNDADPDAGSEAKEPKSAAVATTAPVHRPPDKAETTPAATRAAPTEAREHVAPPPTKRAKPKTEQPALDLSERR